MLCCNSAPHDAGDARRWRNNALRDGNGSLQPSHNSIPVVAAAAAAAITGGGGGLFFSMIL
jgi:hypothetical protein